MLFTSPSLPLPPGDNLPPSVVFTFDDSCPSQIGAEFGGQSHSLSAYDVMPGFGAKLAAGELSVVLPPLPPDAQNVIAANLVGTDGMVYAHACNGPPVWSWSTASVQHDGAGHFRVYGGAGFVKLL
jgi:hypothetical protein